MTETPAGSRFWRPGYGAIHQAFASTDKTARDRWIQQAADDAIVTGAAIWTSSTVLQADSRVTYFDISTPWLLRHATSPNLLAGRAAALDRDDATMFTPIVILIDDITLTDPASLECAEIIAVYGRKTGVALAVALECATLAVLGSGRLRASIQQWETASDRGSSS
jgi:hypothetical protein